MRLPCAITSTTQKDYLGECQHFDYLPLILRPLEILCKGLHVQTEISALAYERCTWETVDVSQVLHEGDVHRVSTSRLHATEMQTLGGS